MEPRVVFARAPVIQRQRQRQRQCQRQRQRQRQRQCQRQCQRQRRCPCPNRARLLSCDVLFHELLELGGLVVGVHALAGLVDVFE